MAISEKKNLYGFLVMSIIYSSLVICYTVPVTICIVSRVSSLVASNSRDEVHHIRLPSSLLLFFVNCWNGV